MTAAEMTQLTRIQAMIESFRATAGYDAVEQLANYLQDTAETYQEELENWEDEE